MLCLITLIPGQEGSEPSPLWSSQGSADHTAAPEQIQRQAGAGQQQGGDTAAWRRQVWQEGSGQVVAGHASTRGGQGDTDHELDFSRHCQAKKRTLKFDIKVKGLLTLVNDGITLEWLLGVCCILIWTKFRSQFINFYCLSLTFDFCFWLSTWLSLDHCTVLYDVPCSYLG